VERGFFSILLELNLSGSMVKPPTSDACKLDKKKAKMNA
jgi:hypothetical protein